MTANRSHRLLLAAAVSAVLAAAALAAPGPAGSAPTIPPTAALTVTPNPVLAGQRVTFDGSGSTGDGLGGTIASYAWDLDGAPGYELNTGTTPTTSRSYTASATISVGLRVTDSEGDTDEDTVSLRVNAGPTAGFIFQPAPAGIGEQVTFSSTSSDPEGPILSTSHRWDFDGDGQFDDALGATVTYSFASAGSHPVALEVTDSDQAKTTLIRNVVVQAAPPAGFDMLSPFPIVRLAGELRPNGNTRIERLSVRAPKGTDAAVRCVGKSCPFDEQARTIASAHVGFPGLEKTLKPGVVIKVFVAAPGKIGKFTRFKLRYGKAPKRKDLCLEGQQRKPIRCPS